MWPGNNTITKKTGVIILGLCVVIQMFLSFVLPTYEPDNSCQHSADYFLNSNTERMQSVFNVASSEFSLTRVFFSLFPNYRAGCDGMSFIFLAKNFPYSYIERNIYIDYPLYNMMADVILKPVQIIKGAPGYPVIFAAFIFVNFLLLLATVILFFLLLYDYLSPKVAFLGGLLLVFSPFAHAFASQTTNSGIMEIFVVMGALWLLYSYAKKPSVRRLVIYSLLFGILLLGKQIIALSLFILFVGLFFKRRKESLAFFVLQFVPTGLWFLFVHFILRLQYYSASMSVYDQGTWFLKAKYWTLQSMGHIALTTLPNYFSTLIYGFLLIPLILSVYGLYKLNLKHKYLLYFGFIVSFLLLFIAMNYYRPSLSFLVFPVIYSTAAVGIFAVTDNLKKYGRYWQYLFFYGSLFLMIVFSNFNFFQFGVWSLLGV